MKIVICLSVLLWAPLSEASLLKSALPFPDWLRDFTGLTEWPGLDPPYIPLDFINFAAIEPSSNHKIGECNNILPNSCSFDCSNCVSTEDIFNCPKLSQTFDDGPSAFTLKLINNLKTPSTFFTLGTQIVKYPEIYKQAMAKGNVMASHSWSHKYLPELTNEEIIAQIEWSVWAMNATGHHLPKYFRPPYGGLDNRVRSIVKQFGMTNVLWNFDTHDWKILLGQRKVSDILKDITNHKSAGNGLILEHDHSSQTVNVGIDINKILDGQLTVPQCVGGVNYLRTF